MVGTIGPKNQRTGGRGFVSLVGRPSRADSSARNFLLNGLSVATSGALRSSEPNVIEISSCDGFVSCCRIVKIS